MKVSKVSVQNEIVCNATIPSCTTVLILLSHNKQDQSYQNSCIFSCYTYFHNLTEMESILIPLLLFVKFIDEYGHQAWNPWKSELKERSSTPNTKVDKVTLASRHRPLFVRYYRAKYFPTQPLKMCWIILLKCKKLEATITFISFLILHWLIKLLSNVTFRMKL